MNACGIFIISTKDAAANVAETVHDLSTLISTLLKAGVGRISLTGFEPNVLSSLSITNDSYLHSKSPDKVDNYSWLRLNNMVVQDVMDIGIILENLKISSEQIASLLDVHNACRTGITLGLTSQLSKDSRKFNVNGTAQISLFDEGKANLKIWYSIGIAIIDRELMPHYGIDPPTSNWDHFLEKAVSEGKVSGCPLYPSHRESMRGINTSWTLFLDRDGVINTRIPGSYIKNPDEFEFIDGVPNALKMLRPLFGRIVVVTNQQGIDKQVMTVSDLSQVHKKMVEILHKNGVKLDAIYFCRGLEKEKPICRKPLPGMALQAVEQFPDIDYSRSIMVGDSKSDIEFGNRLGMVTVKVGESCSVEDYVIDSLSDLPSLLAASFK